jgi:hypothetical protein
MQDYMDKMDRYNSHRICDKLTLKYIPCNIDKQVYHRAFNCLVYRQLSANLMVVTTILFAHTTFLWATCCLTCFIPIVKPFLTLILTTVRTVYLIWKQDSRRVWPVNRGCLLLHGTWSHLWYLQRWVYAPSLICISNRSYEIDYCSLFLSFHQLVC